MDAHGHRAAAERLLADVTAWEKAATDRDPLTGLPYLRGVQAVSVENAMTRSLAAAQVHALLALAGDLAALEQTARPVRVTGAAL